MKIVRCHFGHFNELINPALIDIDPSVRKSSPGELLNPA